MAIEIKVPAVGESITEGTVGRWLKKDGEAVRADEPLLELETDKATAEIAAPAAGTLRIAVPEGQTVPIGTVLARIEEGAAATKPQPTAKKREGPARPTQEKPDGSAKPTEPPKKPTPESAPSPPAAPARPALVEAEVRVSPAARRLIEEEGLDARQVVGTGPGGRITKEDVLGHLEQARAQARDLAQEARDGRGGVTPQPPQREAPPAPPAPQKKAEPGAAPRETRRRMTSIRQRIAERLVAAQRSAAILTTFNEADLSAVMALRERYKDAFREKHGVSLGLMAFFVKATVDALGAFPVVNAWIDGSDIVYHDYYHIGIAVSTDRGLMVPVLRHADRLSFAEIEKRIAELAQKARDGKIVVDDLQGGTFTITNGGVFGSLLSTPILNPPQSAILGMHTIQKRPVALNDQVVIRPMMYLALSYDHRLIDGRDAVGFLVRVKQCIEDPERLLLEI